MEDGRQEGGRWGARKAREENENWDACRKAKARAVQISAPDGPDLEKTKNLGGSAGRDELNCFSRGSTGPPVSQATREVLDSCFLNQSKNHCFSSSGDVLSLSPFCIRT